MGSIDEIKSEAEQLADELKRMAERLKAQEKNPAQFSENMLEAFTAHEARTTDRLVTLERDIRALQDSMGQDGGELGTLHSMDNLVRSTKEAQGMVLATVETMKRDGEPIRYEHIRSFALKEMAAVDDLTKVANMAGRLVEGGAQS